LQTFFENFIEIIFLQGSTLKTLVFNSHKTCFYVKGMAFFNKILVSLQLKSHIENPFF